MSSLRRDRPVLPDRIREAIREWEERCDLDFRCPEAGRHPRYWSEYADWAWKHAQEVVDYLRSTASAETGGR